MEDKLYITEVQAWLTPEEAPVVLPTPPLIEIVSPRSCGGCGEPLPNDRKRFHNKACQGAWLGRRNAPAIAVEELTDKMPDPDAGLELNEEVVERLHRSLDEAPESLLSSEEMRKRLNL